MVNRNSIQPADPDKVIRVGDQHQDDSTEMYQFVDVYVCPASNAPDGQYKVQARPYELDGVKAVKFATTCPDCGAGIFFSDTDINLFMGYKFIGCPDTGWGMDQEVQTVIDDPFQHPIKENKISDETLDQDLLSVLGDEDDGKTVADKLP